MLEIDEWLFEGRLRIILLAAYVIIGLLAAADILADMGEGTDAFHVTVEIIVIVMSLTGALIIVMRLLGESAKSRRLIQEITEELHHHRAQTREWRDETQTLLKGLSASINNQFERWKLSASEKEIGLLLLKGLSHKEVAYIRGVTEATARQQARAIYKKAGLTGRHDLAAFFLEDLALPVDQG